MTDEASEGRQRSIFITGAASGIGRATATFFADRGWFVGACDVDTTGLDSLGQELDPKHSMMRELDVSDRAEFQSAMDEFSKASDACLDLLFNNAGIGAGGFFEDVPYEVAMRIVEVNFLGVVNGVYAGIPLLKNTPNSLCFSVSSSAALFGMPRTAMYSVKKAEALTAE